MKDDDEKLFADDNMLSTKLTEIKQKIKAASDEL